MLKLRKVRFAIVALACAALMLGAVAPAFADIDNTWFDYKFTVAHKNFLSDDVEGADGKWTQWVNQDIKLERLEGGYTTWDGVDPDTFTDVKVPAKLSINGGTLATFTAPITLSKEGTYALSASSIDGSGSVFSQTLDTWWNDDIWGIDKTRPTASTNAKPVYDEFATVTVTAADTLSGAQYVLSSLDGESDWATDTVAPGKGGKYVGTVDVTAGMGSHSLSYFAIDNAGNIGLRQTVAFSVNPKGYVPVLSKPTAKVAKKKATFKGSVTAATSAATVKLVVDRKSGKKYKKFATYYVTVPKYVSTYSVAKKLKKAGTFRVRAYQGTAASSGYRTFKVK